MFKVKNLVTIMLTVLILTGLLMGCGSNPPLAADSGAGTTAPAENNSTQPTENGSKTAITFWTLFTRQGALDEIVKSFNAANDDIEVTVAYYNGDSLKDSKKVAASSRTLPHMWFNWGGSLGGFYSDNGLTYDLTDYAKANDWDNIFSAGALALCTRNGQLTGYPTAYNVLGVYYRKDIFEQYGLSVPTTFEEFETVCATLKENGIVPITTSGLGGWHVMRFVELLIEHYAGPGLHDQMSVFAESHDNDAVIKALTKYKEFCDKGYFPEGFITTNPDDVALALFTGTSAMDIQGQWFDGVILENAQDMNLYGAFAFPSGNGTNRMSAFAEMTQFNANLTDAELEACMRFMNYYYNDENVNKYTEYYGLPLPKQGQAMPEGRPNVPDLLEASNKNGTFTITDQAFPTEIADALFNVQAAIANGQMDPAEGAATIQAAVEAYHGN